MNEKLLSTLKRLVMLTLIGFAFSLTADDETSQRVQERTYPGGKDEESLDVQAALPVPVRKVYRQTIEAKQIKNKKRGPQGAKAPAASPVTETPVLEKVDADAPVTEAE